VFEQAGRKRMGSKWEGPRSDSHDVMTHAVADCHHDSVQHGVKTIVRRGW